MENKHIAAVGVIALGIVLIILLNFNSTDVPKFEDQFNPNANTSLGTGQTPSPQVTELTGQDLKVGTGSAVAAGDNIKVHYVGSFLDGRKFDSSYDRREPLQIAVGAGSVIPGFEQGVVGMKTGGRRKIVVPSNMAYGAQGQGPIPPNTPIQFEIELLEIIPKDTPTPEVSEEPSPSPTPSPNP
jgi:FKBP-type peptidyl-prolyl cis-trans isomerase